MLLLDAVASLPLGLKGGSVLAGLHTPGQIWFNYAVGFTLVLRRLLIASLLHVLSDGFTVGALGVIMLLDHLSRLFNCVQCATGDIVSSLQRLSHLDVNLVIVCEQLSGKGPLLRRCHLARRLVDILLADHFDIVFLDLGCLLNRLQRKLDHVFIFGIGSIVIGQRLLCKFLSVFSDLLFLLL